jgi:hypothetical protein
VSRRRKPAKQVDDRRLRLEYMGGRCVICRRSVDEAEREYLNSKGIFEFNHIDPAKKAPNYDNLIRRVLSAPQLDELDKCNLLCGVCHGAWTNQRMTGKMSLTQTLPDGRQVTSSFRHHGLLKMKNEQPNLYIFADDPCPIGIYESRLGNGDSIIRMESELASELPELWLATREHGTLRIADQKGLVLRADRIDDSKLHFDFLVRFPIIKFEGKPDKPGDPHVWVRNGKMVIEGRHVSKVGTIGVDMEYTAIERGILDSAKNQRSSAVTELR